MTHTIVIVAHLDTGDWQDAENVLHHACNALEGGGASIRIALEAEGHFLGGGETNLSPFMVAAATQERSKQ